MSQLHLHQVRSTAVYCYHMYIQDLNGRAQYSSLDWCWQTQTSSQPTQSQPVLNQQPPSWSIQHGPYVARPVFSQVGNNCPVFFYKNTIQTKIYHSCYF